MAVFLTIGVYIYYISNGNIEDINTVKCCYKMVQYSKIMLEWFRKLR